MGIYKNWKIEKGDYGYYEATSLKDCDAFMKQSKNKDELKAEIDEENDDLHLVEIAKNMIKPEELRRNNLLMQGNDIATVMGLPFDDFIQYSIESWGNDIIYGEPYESFEPIELTEEWLIKFGFNRIGKDFVINGIIIHDRKRGYSLRKSVPDIKNVHSLQNLMFALTNKELTKK